MKGREGKGSVTIYLEVQGDVWQIWLDMVCSLCGQEAQRIWEMGAGGLACW